MTDKQEPVAFIDKTGKVSVIEGSALPDLVRAIPDPEVGKAVYPLYSASALASKDAEIAALREALEPFAKRAPVQGFAAGIPWDMHLRAYDAYCKEYGPQKALIENGCRGGFGTRELDKFIPGWRDEVAADFRRARAELEKHNG